MSPGARLTRWMTAPTHSSNFERFTMTSKFFKITAAALLLSGSVAAFAAQSCCGDLACCIQRLLCCL